MQSRDNNPNLDDVSIPVKITDSIFMGDEVIAHVPLIPLRTYNG